MILLPIGTWSDFKTLVSDKKLLPQYIDNGNTWDIYALDGGVIVWNINLFKGSSDATDFENNHQSNYNKSLADDDGAPTLRPKAAKKGWTYHLCGIEFETSVLSSIVHNDVDGNALNEASIKFYDSGDVELTTQGDCDTSCVKTVLEFEPLYDYEIIGGTIKTISTITNDYRVWVVAVPDLTPAQGGTKVMVENLNLKFVDPNNGVEVDGRASKLMKYDATYHTNKLRLTIKHPAGGKEKLLLALEVFRA